MKIRYWNKAKAVANKKFEDQEVRPVVKLSYYCSILYYLIITKRGTVNRKYSIQILPDFCIECVITDQAFSPIGSVVVWTKAMKSGRNTGDCYFEFKKEDGW